MHPVLVLTHVAVALIAAAGATFWLRRRHHRESQRLQVANDALRADLQRAQGEIEALMPQAMQALGLESTLTLKNAEHARLEAASASELDACRRRLAETEQMTVSLQQALIDARAELAAAQAAAQAAIQTAALPAASPGAAWPADPAGAPIPTLAQVTSVQTPAVPGTLDELKDRLANIVSASRKWQRGNSRH